MRGYDGQTILRERAGCGPDLANAETQETANADGAYSQRHRSGGVEPPVKVQLSKTPNRHSLPRAKMENARQMSSQKRLASWW